MIEVLVLQWHSHKNISNQHLVHTLNLQYYTSNIFYLKKEIFYQEIFSQHYTGAPSQCKTRKRFKNKYNNYNHYITIMDIII